LPELQQSLTRIVPSYPTTVVTFVATWSKESQPESFTVHKEFDCCYSSHPKDFLNGTKAPKTKAREMYDLEGFHPEAVRLFVQWLYTQSVTLKSGDLNHPDYDLLHGDNDHLHTLWILAKKLSIPSLQNFAMQKLHVINVRYLGFLYPPIRSIYQKTQDSSPLRRFAVIVTAHDDNFPNSYPDTSDHTKQFLLDLATHLKHYFKPGTENIRLEDYLVHIEN
jgi:hypothetical protein